MKNKLLILLLSITSFLHAQVSDAGLLAYYNFDNDTNNQVVGSTQFDLVATGVAPTTASNCINGSNCVGFNGTGALITADFFNQMQNNPNQSLSVSFWVKDVLPLGNQFGSMIEFFESMFLRGRSPFNVGINTSSNDASYNIFEDTGYNQNSNIFIHFVLVYDAFNQRLRYYRNGVLISEQVTTGQTIRLITQTAFIGGGSDSSGNFSSVKGFFGFLDEMYVFNRALLATEVTSLFNLETPQPVAPISGSDLLAYYSFDNTLVNEAPGATQFNLGVVGNTATPPVLSGGIEGGDIDNNFGYGFNGTSAFATDDFGPYFANSTSQDFSVSMWLDTPNSAGFRTLIEMFASAFLRGRGEFGVSTVNGQFNSNQVILLGNSQWQHVSLVFDSTNRILKFYVNGNFERSISTTTGDIIRYNDTTVIGGGTNGDGSMSSTKYFTGTLDEVYIFNRVLSPGEVYAFANKSVPTVPPPSCPTGDVTFNNQIEVDDFVAQFPTCTTVDGNLTITGNVSDLSGLTTLTTINGNFNVSSTTVLTSLLGLDNLDTIGGDVNITSNTAFTSLNGFSNLANFSGAITISANNNLTDISTLENIPYTIVTQLSIENNTSLATCESDFVCDFVFNVSANATISGNAAGCSTLSEVQTACVASNPPCPPGNVTFDTQAQLDAYLIQYPNCDTINGTVLIGAGVNDLSGLTSLTTITGRLQFLFPSGLTSLNGLQNLANVNQIRINGATGLTNLNEFSNLTSVSEISISNCSALNDITGLSGITTINAILNIFNNGALQSLNGLQNFTTTAFNANIFIEDNPILTDISALNNLNFANVSFLQIRNNSVLENCTSDFVCNYLDNLNANRAADIVNNASGCNSVTEVQTACAAIPPTCPTGNVMLNSQADVDNFVLQFPNCTVINGNLKLEGNIFDITALINITQITGFLEIVGCQLENLDGLNALVNVGDRTRIFGNPNLERVDGLERLESTTELSFTLNTNLTEISLPALQNIPLGIFIDENDSLNSIQGLSNLSNGNIGPISITENPVLENLNGLENVQNVTNMFIWANPNLNDISAIANIPYLNVGVLTIANNTSLSVCTNMLVCDMIGNNRNISITGNASGCSNLTEVSASCATLSTNQFEQKEIKTYPNPFTDFINIQLPLGVDKASVKIMNVEGKVVYTALLNNNQSNINDLQTLSKGVYLLQLTFDNGQVATYKIVK